MTDHIHDMDATPEPDGMRDETPRTGAPVEPEAGTGAQAEPTDVDETRVSALAGHETRGSESESDETQVIEPVTDETRVSEVTPAEAPANRDADAMYGAADATAEGDGAATAAAGALVTGQEPEAASEPANKSTAGDTAPSSEATTAGGTESSDEGDADGATPPDKTAAAGEHPSPDEADENAPDAKGPERKASRLWWAWCIVAAIVIVAIAWICLFIFPPADDSFSVVQDPEAIEDVAAGTGAGATTMDESAATGEIEPGTPETPDAGTVEEPAPEAPAEPETVTPDQPATDGNSAGGVATLSPGSVGPHTLRTSDGHEWTIDPQGLLAPVEIHGMGSNGVTIAFMPGDGGQNVAIRFTSLTVDGQTYQVGAPDSPVHYEVTAGQGGERDITGDPSFTVGTDEAGNYYGERVLIRVDGLTEDAYNGLVLSLEETGPDGVTVPGTITLTGSVAIGDS